MNRDRTGLAIGICTRIMALAHQGDELDVLDGFLARLELGLHRYGPLDLLSDRRDFDREADEEILDWEVYRACKRTARRIRDERRTLEGLEELRGK